MNWNACSDLAIRQSTKDDRHTSDTFFAKGRETESRSFTKIELQDRVLDFLLMERLRIYSRGGSRSPRGRLPLRRLPYSLVAGIILTEEVIRLRRMLRLGAAEIVNANLETFRKTENRFRS